MSTKRKHMTGAHAAHERPAKRSRPDKRNKHDGNKGLVFSPRPDWHGAELPALPEQATTAPLPAQTIEELQQYAKSLLDADNASYEASHLAGSSSHKFLSTVMSSGTLEDRVSALTLLVQESPLHNIKAFESLLGLAKKKSRNQALMAIAALKDLLGQGVVLPKERKLRAFGKQPALLAGFQGKAARWTSRDPLPAPVDKVHLIVWAFEDWLKKAYFELLHILETWCSDEVEYARSRAVTYVWELLKDKPEQEENLLRLLVNKLGDKARKVASRTSYLLLQLQSLHPAMKLIVTNSIEADCLFRPGQSSHAKYYAIITLNQTILTAKEQEVSNRLLEIYFGLFVELLKPTDQKSRPANGQTNGKVQGGGGGKPGKMAAKKQKAEERAHEAVAELNDKMIAQVLAGVNRAFPYADTSDPTFEKQLDTIFRVAHSANFNTSVQALVLLQQISSRKHYGAERFYRTLYESVLDPRLFSSSKQVMYLNLLYKSLKADLNAKRVQAFVKRLLQVITMHEPPFACGVLYLISELQISFAGLRHMLTDAEANDEDEEEHFVDVPEDGETTAAQAPTPTANANHYDARKRDPEHAHAERSCLWDILPMLQHFHPSVSLFAETVFDRRRMQTKPDVTQHTLMHFLDRFVYRNARTKPSSGRGISIMQPSAGSVSVDLLVRPRDEVTQSVPLNSEAFWTKKVQDVAADEVFFHSYFNAAGNSKRKTAEKKKKQQGSTEEHDDSDSIGEGSDEDEIWQAIANSRPEVEGPDDDDDDVSLGDLESAYDRSDDDDDGSASEAGIDLGGEDGIGDGDAEAEAFDFGDGDDMDSLPDLDSDEGALLEDDDDVAVEMDGDEQDEADGEGEEEGAENTSRNRKKRQERKKLKQLPVFASADDYAKLLDAEPDDM